MGDLKHLSVHQWIRSAIPDSQQPTSPIGFLFLKLPPPPCAVLLVAVVVVVAAVAAVVAVVAVVAVAVAGCHVALIPWHIDQPGERGVDRWLR